MARCCARISRAIEFDRLPAPTILVRTTYDKQRAQDTRDAEGFARSGYVFVIQDVLGRYTSDGCFYHGVDEADDGRDTIDWIARQPWSNGKVGMTGISYLGAVQCAAAISGTPTWHPSSTPRPRPTITRMAFVTAVPS